MSQSRFAAIILAAGSGTRMKSAIPKVMHPIAGRPMIAHLLDALHPLSPAATVVVVGPQMESVARIVAPAESVVQDPPLGTGDAVRTALQALDGRLAPQGGIDKVLVLCGDTPFLATDTLSCGQPNPVPMAGSFSRPTVRSNALSRPPTPASSSRPSGSSMAGSW